MIENTILTGVITVIFITGLIWLMFRNEILFYILKEPKIEGIYVFKSGGNYTRVKVTGVYNKTVYYKMLDYNGQKVSLDSDHYYDTFLSLYERIG